MKKANLLLLTLFLASCDAGIGTGFISKLVPKLLFSSTSLSTEVGTNITVTWTSENTSSCIASGAWSGSKEPSGSENININTVGSNEFLLTCQGPSNKTASSSLIVYGQKIFTGRVIDGYIRDAKVYIDRNNNFINDENEPFTYSDNEGLFELQYQPGTIISEGGFDILTGNLVDKLTLSLPLYGYTEYKTVTPLTSLLTFFENRANLNLSLGIDSSIDLSSIDPEAMKNEGPLYAYLYEKGNQIALLALGIQVFAEGQYGNSDTSEMAFKSIASILEENYLSLEKRVDIESPDFIGDVIDHFILFRSEENLNIIKPQENLVTHLKDILSSLLPIVELKSSQDTTTEIFNFATSILMEDIRKVASDTFGDGLINNYMESITSYIAYNQSLNEIDLYPNTELNFDNISLPITTQTLEINEDKGISDSTVFVNNYTLLTNENNLPITLSNLEFNNGQFTADVMVDPSFYSFERLSAFELNLNSSGALVLNDDAVKMDIFGHSFGNNKGTNDYNLVWISPLALNTLENQKIATLRFQLQQLNQSDINLVVESTLIGGEKNSINSEESAKNKTVYTLIGSQSEINI